ncbi:MORN repeat-containing protein 1-like isoform X3 [Biomphalaria glabrata]|uniref:MORN repeat-containing protein 1-like isoform X3 n=1 Tax=Biomphalaria glabrata TaxID=6526 RepID=A0A9U8EDV8_BIOGL|nr:MORN repeat-containing protein 1-like isoform X3 [Biomphalaria glabrata]
MADFAKERRKEPYLGEKVNYLRNGYGTYVYENQFFRYDGEWVDGKKHGHGKLLMKDGTFYEGQFTKGEITGSGYKYFATSNAKYTGEFLCGEMHGNGMMAYKDGSVYKGQWQKNRRQGFGTLWTQKKSIYEGTFYEDMRDGEGKQNYDNGDKYEGHWIQDKRNGQGHLWCADGSHYEGNFVNDLFHGEGKISHASGIYYRGLWLNGFPEKMATKIVILCESSLVLQQGQLFSIHVECRNDDDELVIEHGRELQLLAGFKYTPPVESSSFFDMIEDFKEQPIHTPFGYDVVPYPISDQLPELEDTTKIDEEAEDNSAENQDTDEVRLSESAKELQETESRETVEEVKKVDSIISDESNKLPEQVTETVREKETKFEEVSQMAPQVQNKVTTNGICEWLNLQLAPPPPMYRPFVILKREEEAKKTKKLSKEKIEIMKEITDEMATQERTESVNLMEDEEEEDSELKTLPFENPENYHNESSSSIQDSDDITNNRLQKEDSIKNNDLQEGDNVFIEEGDESNLGSHHSLASKEKKSSQQIVPEKEIYETIARPGEYVLIVREVTNPPFLGKTMQPAFLLLQLNQKKKTVTKKPKGILEASEDEEHDEKDSTYAL